MREHPTDGADAGPSKRSGAHFSAWDVMRVLYYLAILSALVALYGRGDVSTSGFIYQAF